MALSVIGDAPVLMKVANPSSQDRTPRRAIPLVVSPAAGPYRASGLVLWRKAAIDAATTLHSPTGRAGLVQETGGSVLAQTNATSISLDGVTAPDFLALLDKERPGRLRSL